MSGGDDPGSPAASSPIYFFFLLLLLLLPISVLSDDKCYSFRCANSKVEIGYPLWNSSEANTRYCGYPNLGVECRDGYPVLELGDDSYRIANVTYNTSTITLQDIDLLGRECPRARHNLTLANRVPLQRTETDAHLLFFFNCSGVEILGNYQLPCLSQNSGVNRYSYVFQEGSVPPASYPWGRCQDFVVATVLEALLPSSPNELLSSFGRVLNQGFELTWSPSDMADCKSCENDGGNCGYKNKGDSRGYEFVCFCSDGTLNCSKGTLPDLCYSCHFSSSELMNTLDLK